MPVSDYFSYQTSPVWRFKSFKPFNRCAPFNPPPFILPRVAGWKHYHDHFEERWGFERFELFEHLEHVQITAAAASRPRPFFYKVRRFPDRAAIPVLLSPSVRR